MSVLCDQDDQVVPAHQVDDIDEVHELDPVHQVDHKDERCDDIGRFWVDIVRFLVDIAHFNTPIMPLRSPVMPLLHRNKIMPVSGMTGPCHATGKLHHAIMPP